MFDKINQKFKENAHFIINECFLNLANSEIDERDQSRIHLSKSKNQCPLRKLLPSEKELELISVKHIQNTPTNH